MKITAALENDSGMFIMEELDLEDPRDDEALVKVAACGICRGFKPGDWVIVAYTHCGKCSACKDGRTYECDYMYHFFGGERPDGSSPFFPEWQASLPADTAGRFQYLYGMPRKCTDQGSYHA
jgi:Zn-dependent alcohol dehydrogenase